MTAGTGDYSQSPVGIIMPNKSRKTRPFGLRLPVTDCAIILKRIAKRGRNESITDYVKWLVHTEVNRKR